MPLMFAFLALAAPQVVAPPGTYQLDAAQVRQCAGYALDRNQRDTELAKRDETLQAEQTRLVARQAELTELSKTVNTKKKKEVDAYNAKSNEFNALVPINSKNIADRNAYAATIAPIIASYNAQCVRRSMNPVDVNALPDDLRAALTANTKTSTIIVPAPPAPPGKRRPR